VTCGISHVTYFPHGRAAPDRATRCQVPASLTLAFRQYIDYSANLPEVGLLPEIQPPSRL